MLQTFVLQTFATRRLCLQGGVIKKGSSRGTPKVGELTFRIITPPGTKGLQFGAETHTRIWSTFAPELLIEAIRMVLLPSVSVAEMDEVRVHVDQLPEAGNASS